MTQKPIIEIYDTTLRDGTQGKDINVSVADKIILSRRLDEFGIDYIEGGWPGSNPRDEEFFAQMQQIPLQHAKLCAFGSTARRPGTAETDQNLRKLIESQAPVVTIFGKTWAFHSRDSLGLTDDENEAVIYESVAFLVAAGRKVFFDAEHFYDGYLDSPEFALRMLRAAERAGASALVLCDTNGGTLPSTVYRITAEVAAACKPPLGVHVHDDSGTAVASSLAAVEAGAMHVQGTINGIGERCGNANLVSIMPALSLKMGYADACGGRDLSKLSKLSYFVDEVLNQVPNARAPYVGVSAFSHKGGIHVSSVLKDARMYEHISPEDVGNRRNVIISDLAGQASIRYLAREFGLTLPEDKEFSKNFVQHIKNLEHEGFQFDGAEASFELLLLAELGVYQPFFKVQYAKVNDLIDGDGYRQSEAILKVMVDGETEHTAADGNGPVNALDKALRKALQHFYPLLRDMHLTDYKVRVLGEKNGTVAKVRVLIESTDGDNTWSTVGLSPDIIEASLYALSDSINYKIYKDSLSNHNP
ncbi:MAG: citramalate synthase [Myxococcales bacterium]|nr:citramalate synthase [Myxococcales bacterium]